MAGGLAPFPNGACPPSCAHHWYSVGCRSGIRPALLSLRAPRRNLDSDQKNEAGGSGGEREARLISRNHLGKLMKSQVRAEAVQHAVEAQWPIRTHGS